MHNYFRSQHLLRFLSLYTLFVLFSCKSITPENVFPDGEKISDWFLNSSKLSFNDFDNYFTITDYGVSSESTEVQTASIQKVIETASESGGGLIVIPKGTFKSGALFFKPNTSLYLEEGAVLKGSDNIEDYPKIPSRMEGQNLNYFSALINAYGVKGFSIFGKGTIDGNGLNFWKAFWERRKENPKCTNLEVSRPRLIFIQNAKNVLIEGVSLINSGFWTTHIYKSSFIKIIDVTIKSPHQPIKAPSTDAIDLDVCNNVLIKGCYIAVNDDAIALKGGKGPWADQDPNNGDNTNVLIEDCTFGFCHAVLTCGSESIHNKNILMRNCKVQGAQRLLRLKMRPDTPQNYEYITLDNVSGSVKSVLYIKPWTQFFDLKGATKPFISSSKKITLKNLNLNTNIFFDVQITENDHLSDFNFENLNIQSNFSEIDENIVENLTLKDVRFTTPSETEKWNDNPINSL